MNHLSRRLDQSTAHRLSGFIAPSMMLELFTIRRMEKREKSSFIACELCETTDACVLLAGSSCTLLRVLGCFEIDTGVAIDFLHFDH